MSYVCQICLIRVINVLCVCYLFTYFAGIAPCMGLRVSFVLFHLSKYHIDYVHVCIYILSIIYVLYSTIKIVKNETKTDFRFSRITTRKFNATVNIFALTCNALGKKAFEYVKQLFYCT